MHAVHCALCRLQSGGRREGGLTPAPGATCLSWEPAAGGWTPHNCAMLSIWMLFIVKNIFWSIWEVEMLKWLVTGKEEGGLPTITDDPLATIPRAKKDRKNEIYSVNRWPQFLKYLGWNAIYLWRMWNAHHQGDQIEKMSILWWLMWKSKSCSDYQT